MMTGDSNCPSSLEKKRLNKFDKYPNLRTKTTKQSPEQEQRSPNSKLREEFLSKRANFASKPGAKSNRKHNSPDLLHQKGYATYKGKGSQQSPRLGKHNGEARKTEPSFEDSEDYLKLHQKLNDIEAKIGAMKKNVEQKKLKKQQYLQQRTKKQNRLKELVTKVPQQRQFKHFHQNPYSPKSSLYYVSQMVKAYNEEGSLAREHLLTSLHILKMLANSKVPPIESLKARMPKLGTQKGTNGRSEKKVVVFDLDETLIHCNDNLQVPYDVKLPIKFPTGEVIEAGINIRPYAQKILQNLSKVFQIIVFTASHSCYANVVLDHFDPNGEFIHHRLYRQHCYGTPEGMYIKDLRVIDRPLKDIVLVDNAAYSYAFQLDNGIPILPYYHGSQDYQLQTLQKYLKNLLLVDDVRQVNKKHFKLSEYHLYFDNPDTLVEQLYKSK